MPHHKKCRCGRIGTVGKNIEPYYQSKGNMVWLCRPCADAELAKKQRKSQKGIAN